MPSRPPLSEFFPGGPLFRKLNDVNHGPFDDGLQASYVLRRFREEANVTADDTTEPEVLSPAAMQEWLRTEIGNATKALDLRRREATALVDAYNRGEISPQEAIDRQSKYSQRWGEALPGVLSAKGLSDEQILAIIDEARDPKFAERLIRKRVVRNDETGGPALSQ